MSFQAPSMGELLVLLTSYCGACVSASHAGWHGDEAPLHDKAMAIAVAARARRCGTGELVTLFKRAWNRSPAWGSLPPPVQSAAYDRALTFLTERFLTER